WLLFGPARSGSNFHVDPNCNFAWNATIQGAKKWLFYPPHVRPPGVVACGPGGEYQQQEVSLIQWFLKHYDEDDDGRCWIDLVWLECISRPGDIIYVPRGWWHCVLNLEDSVALAQNVVTERNLLAVTDFLEDAPPCPPGRGCKGGDPCVNEASGRGCKGGDPDVPTSVIFPYRRPDISDAPGISDISGTSGVVSGISGVASEDVSRAGGGGGVADADAEPAKAGGGGGAALGGVREDGNISAACTCMKKKQEMLEALEAGVEQDRPGRLAALRQARDAQAHETPTFSFGF
ncbi:hypothetical protein T484DRAFT_1765204, partial [Baffinella frigidus]